MAVKRVGQSSLVEAWLPGGLAGSRRLDRLTGLVDWSRFEHLLAGLKDERPGRPGYPALIMFKALVLQSLYGLSDPELEDALLDRLSFRRFAGLSLEDHVPDHSTICRFRNALVASGVQAKLFAELDWQLENAGVIVKRGTMLDATVIESGAARPPRRDRKSDAIDPDAGFAKRQGRIGSTYGYKMHVGVDSGSGLIRRVVATPANIPDTTPADALVCGDEREVLADKAYHTHGREAAFKARGIKPRLMRRPNKHHPVLPPRVQRLNALISRRRAAVETTFATLKRRMKLTTIRYVGLAKAEAQIVFAAMAFNMRRWMALSPADSPRPQFD